MLINSFLTCTLSYEKSGVFLIIVLLQVRCVFPSGFFQGTFLWVIFLLFENGTPRNRCFFFLIFILLGVPCASWSDINWGNSQSLLLPIFLLFLSVFFSWYFHYMYIVSLVVAPQSLVTVLFCVVVFSVFVLFVFQIWRYILIYSLPTESFPQPCPVY